MNKEFNHKDLNELEQEVIITNDENTIQLNGIMACPNQTEGIIIFAHGSGSGRFSPRNNFVAHKLQEAHLGTLLMDLLSEEEATNRANVFDIMLLADRLRLAKSWLQQKPEWRSKKIGYFGASTGAGAALVAAAIEPENVFAIVSRGGRPDLAGEFLKTVQAPTLLLVGGDDDIVIDLNQEAFDKLPAEKDLKIIPGATHLFEEPGTLEQVADLAIMWFAKYL